MPKIKEDIMSEMLLTRLEEAPGLSPISEAADSLGKITVLEALAEETEGISINASHRSTQMGNGVDAEDD
jgi:hypothetical protein